MKSALISLWVVALLGIFPAALPSQQKLTAGNLPGFLARYDTNFGPVEAALKDFASQNFPLHDEGGQPAARRRFEDRLLALSNLRLAARQLAAKPEDLVLATTVALRTEALADDLFGLSQEAFDNDCEELADRLNKLQMAMGEDADLLADYLLTLATEKQERLTQLEKEVDELHQKLKEGAHPAAPGKQ